MGPRQPLDPMPDHAHNTAEHAMGLQPMEPPEILIVEEETVACDGGDGPLGHPRVFLHMDGNGQVDCPYCGRRFILAEDSGGLAA